MKGLNLVEFFLVSLKEPEAAAWRCSVKKVFLEVSQNSQENTCARVSFFDKLADLRPAILLINRLWRRFFPVNFAKFLRTLFLTEHLRWLLLKRFYIIFKSTFSKEIGLQFCLKLSSLFFFFIYFPFHLFYLQSNDSQSLGCT